jgi:hypothetical protein
MGRASGNEDWSEVERRPPVSQLEADAILRLLLEAKIDFVVVGGLAVGAHGFVRATKDIDVVPNPEPANLAAFEDVLFEINARPIERTDFGPDEMPIEWEPGALLHGGNWALDSDHGRIDILQYIHEVEVIETYIELRDQALLVDVPDVGNVCFASFEHLELMKRVAGRPQDLNDLEQLRYLRGTA